MKTAPLLILSLLSLSMFAGVLFALPVRAAPIANGSSAPDGISPITLPTSTSDDAEYATTCPGGLSGCSGVPGTSWGATIFSVTATTTVSITITDCCYEGDYYALYSTTDPTGLTGWTLVGTTDQVATGSELAAPTYDSAWTGTGTSYSSTTFDIPQTGTVLYAVRDVLFDTMVTLLGAPCTAAGFPDVVHSGCTATGISASPEWSPAGYLISFADAGTSGCLTGGATSWPTVTFTDFSTADVSVTGGVLSGSACPSMTIEDTFTSIPSGTTTPAPVTSPNYYDLSITGLSAGTATLCITGSLVTSTTTMMYWNGNMWVSATGITVVGDKICGQIPVTALDTPSTPVAIGTGKTITGAPQFGSPAIAIAALGLVAVAILSKKLKPAIVTPQ